MKNIIKNIDFGLIITCLLCISLVKLIYFVFNSSPRQVDILILCALMITGIFVHFIIKNTYED